MAEEDQLKIIGNPLSFIIFGQWPSIRYSPNYIPPHQFVGKDFDVSIFVSEWEGFPDTFEWSIFIKNKNKDADPNDFVRITLVNTTIDELGDPHSVILEQNKAKLFLYEIEGHWTSRDGTKWIVSKRGNRSVDPNAFSVQKLDKTRTGDDMRFLHVRFAENNDVISILVAEDTFHAPSVVEYRSNVRPSQNPEHWNFVLVHVPMLVLKQQLQIFLKLKASSPGPWQREEDMIKDILIFDYMFRHTRRKDGYYRMEYVRQRWENYPEQDGKEEIDEMADNILFFSFL